MSVGIVRRLARIPWVRTLSRPLFWLHHSARYVTSLARFVAAAGTTSAQTRPRFAWRELSPCLWDRTATTGFDEHYTYHPPWAARILARERPERHVDIGSTLHFCSMVSAFIPVDFYDYRPANLQLSGLTLGHTDLTGLQFPSQSIRSLSCMHVVEHIGLGRYGDSIDPDGDLKAMSELQRVLAPGGDLLFVVPVGRPRIQFNAHRIYSYEQILSGFPQLRLVEFSLIPDDSSGGMIKDAPAATVNDQSYACGCFWLRRP